MYEVAYETTFCATHRLTDRGSPVEPLHGHDWRVEVVAAGDDLDAHLAAYQRFMPGLRLERVGEVRQCQGAALVDWVARGADGTERGRGTSAFELAPDGRIGRVTGFWA